MRLENLIRAVAIIEAPGAISQLSATKQEVASKLAQLSIGEQLRGEVLEKRLDGSFNVKLAEFKAQMTLPESIKKGDTVLLRVLSMQPELSFSLEGAESSTASTLLTSSVVKRSTPSLTLASDGKLLATGAQEISQTQASRTPILQVPTTLDSSIEKFSKTSLLISQIILQQPAAHETHANQSTPIVKHPTDLSDPKQLAEKLSNKIQHSGVFYESHLAQWASGQISQAALQSEPQAKLQLLQNNHFIEENIIVQLDPKVGQLISQQLNTLENQQVRWQGELFPGQTIKWEIRREARDNSQTKQVEKKEPVWQSNLSLSLPNLGNISAQIQLQGQHLRLSIKLDNEALVEKMKAQLSSLNTALDNTGVILDSLRTEHGNP